MNNSIEQMTFDSLLTSIMSSKVDFMEVRARLEEKPHKVIDTGIHPKILADWNRHGLLMVKPEPNKMHRFSLTEFVWVKFIEKMRAHNFPIPTIKAFKDTLIGTSLVEQVGEITPSFLFDNMKGIEGIKEDPEHLKAFLNKVGIDKILESMIPKEVLSGNMLELVIMFSLFLQTPYSFFIDNQGKGILFNPLMLNDGAYDKKEITELFSKSFVSISLTEVLSEVLVLSDLEILNGQLKVINDMEANVLEALREDDLVSIVIRYDKDNQMDLMEVKKLQKAERESRVMDLMLKDGYEDIILKTQHGKIVHCQNTRKVKLK
jgi:DNA-binding transcriptional MerR regulator